MKAVLGFLLIFVGIAGVYLVLSGKFPTSSPIIPTTTSTPPPPTTAAKGVIINNPRQGYQPGKLSGMN